MKKRLTIDEKKAELRAAGRKVKNTLTDAEVNKQYRAFLAETAATEESLAPQEVEELQQSGGIEFPEEPEDSALEEFADIVPGGDLTERITESDVAKSHRLPVAILEDYFAILTQLSIDGDISGDKSPVVVEWLRDNLTAEEFEYKYAHRGIK
jgi:hypothetical protein